MENPEAGDPGRRLRPGTSDDDPCYFHMFNANRKSVTINLNTPRGLEIVEEMLKNADVTAENMAPERSSGWGSARLSCASRTRASSIVRSKALARAVRMKKGPAVDMIAQAAGGPISVTGEPDRPPVQPGPSFGDAGTGMLMAVMILGALYNRQGKATAGDAIVHYMRTCLAMQARTGRPPRRRGGQSVGGNNSPLGLWRVERLLYIAPASPSPEHWMRLLKLIS